MPVNLEIKGMLAKLLATEDIIIENKKVDTACFNVGTRVLTLPLWERASDTVYSTLVLHEVGHSRFTSTEDWTKTHKIPATYVNIVEDARVEKLMKRKFLGSAKTFYAGYNELHDQDFFGIGDDDYNTYSLADRVNLHFKIGNFLDIEFTPEEKEIVNLIGNSETFDDALNAAEVLYKYCKEEHKEKEKEKVDFPTKNTQGESGSGNENSETPQNNQGENDAEESQSNSQQSSQNNDSSEFHEQGEESKTSSNNNSEEPEIKTVDNLSESIRQLANNHVSDTVYVEIPKVNLKNIIIPNSEIHKVCDDFWVSYKERNQCDDSIYSEVDSDYRKFKKSSQKEVNYLVKEFECRKAADSYARASTARTGILDCTKLHTYKFNDDLFLKVTTFAEGKNHGLVFILDWSGSMANVMKDTIKQLFNLIWFCRKVSIPFEVYAFTNSYPRVEYDENGKAKIETDLYVKGENVLCIESWFSLMNLFTSKVSNSVLEKQMQNMYRIACSFRSTYRYMYEIPRHFNLSGTPLNDAIYCLHDILPKFKTENKLQKVQCVILTDGEGTPPKRNIIVRRYDMVEPYFGANYIGSNCYLRDRKTGHTYRLDCNQDKATDIFIQNLRDKFADMNFIGIRILEPRDAGFFMRKYCGYYGNEYVKLQNSWKKDKSFVIKNSGYHSYFAISSSVLDNDTEFEVAEDATKSQIKTAFVKSLKSKKMNKKILGEFISLVA